MNEVAPLVGDVLVEQAVLLNAFLIVPGTGLHSVKLFLELCQLFLGLLQPVGSVGWLTAVGHVEVGHGVFQA